MCSMIGANRILFLWVLSVGTSFTNIVSFIKVSIMLTLIFLFCSLFACFDVFAELVPFYFCSEEFDEDEDPLWPLLELLEMGF